MIVQLICKVKYYKEKNTLIMRSNIYRMYVEVLMKLNFLFTCFTRIYVWLKQKGHEEEKRGCILHYIETDKITVLFCLCS